MPVKLSYSNINKRFDFAVPLEDIFKENNIHPRLMFIFQQTYELYMETHLSIDDILKEQGSLTECLELKERIIYENQPGINLQYIPLTSYFWIIRHFLGLLPVPLIPTVTSTHRYPWKDLAKKCRNFFYPDFRKEEDYSNLHWTVARSLNNLPQEHIIFLNVLIAFIREISKKKFCKKTVLSLSKYYCDSIFARPFRPGHRNKDETMLPLLVYLITRWYHILKYLRTDIPIFSHKYNYVGFEMEKNYLVNSYTQTNRFTTELTTFNRHKYNVVKYLKDVECQTDTSEITSTTNSALVKIYDKTVNDENWSISSNINEELSFKSFSVPLRGHRMSFVSSLVGINEAEEDIECKQCEKSDIFSNTLKNERKNDWSDVVKEIATTVKKVEGYDFETEDTDADSDGEYKSFTSYLSDSTFDGGSIETEYNSFRDSTLKSTKNDQRLPNSLLFKSIRNESKEKSSYSNKKIKLLYTDEFYRSFCDSDEELYATNEKESSDIIMNKDDTDVSTIFSLKKFKIKFKFLRTLSPKFSRSRDDFSRETAKNIKYKKIKT